MDLTNLDTIKLLLREFSTTTERKFGQNFLIDKKVLFNLICGGELESTDTVIEVGPGIGTVTKEIANQVKNVYAFEIDESKLPILERSLQTQENVVILNEDFLQVQLSDFLEKTGIKKYKFISSLPYNISKKILQLLLESENKPEIISVLIQKEVAEKYIPTKGGTFLSNYLEILGKGKIVMKLGPNSFYPAPKVESAILQIIPKKNIEVDRKLIKFIKNGFKTPRKKLLNVISNIYRDVDWKKAFNSLDLNDNVRAGQLKLEIWINLYNFYKNELSN